LRVLLDESLPRGLARLLSGHELVTVAEEGWAGMKNGELLMRAGESFDAFITIDANLPYQQTLERFSIGVVLLRAPSNRLADLEPLVPEILTSLDGLEPGELRKVGAWSRRGE
jgi:hypothetical protein